MSNSLALYRPSVLELARGGNLRAIAFWINSLLGPYGIYIHVVPSRSGQLNILVDFKQQRRRAFYVALQKQLVRFICYRLWTLNSEKIRDVRIVARMAGEQEILWKQSVRIVTPANRENQRESNHLRDLTRRGAAWIRFQVLRSAMMSRFALATFFLCYWLLYWDLAGKQAAEQQSLAAMAAHTITLEQSNQPSAKGQLRAGTASNTTSENNLIQLGRSVQQELIQKTISEQFVGKLVYQVKLPENEKVVALTFDDGPWQTTTEQVLDILKQNDVKATFFWVGQALQNNPDIARKVVADGHAIGNHTWRHIMDNVDQATAAEELGNTARLIYETTGLHTNLFRPPGGNLEGSMVPYAKNQKNVITMWSAESDDYYVSAPIIVDNVLSRVQPGGIVLMHDGGGDRSQTVQALPQIITALKQQGYRFVTVPELLALQAKEKDVVQPPVAAPATGSPAPGSPATGSNDPSLLNPTPGLDVNVQSSPQENPTIAPTATPSAAPGDAFNGLQQNPTVSPTTNPVPDTLIPGANGNGNNYSPQNPAVAPTVNPIPGDMTGAPQASPTFSAPPANQAQPTDNSIPAASEDALTG